MAKSVPLLQDVIAEKLCVQLLLVSFNKIMNFIYMH